ncbi:MAG TPA: CapA family protein [Chthoniobacteraceae bacterium]|nr:CapA family protein [Chthoniobacteraceae bacterium]
MPLLTLWNSGRTAQGPAIRIAALGDLCPVGGFEKRLLETPLAEVIDPELLEAFRSSDAVVANLEAVLTTAETWRVPGIGLRASPRVAPVLREMGITHATLANNHMRDLLCTGVRDTIGHCRESGIVPIGAGADLDAASEPWAGAIGGVRVGIIAVAEREFNMAGPNHAGTALFDPAALPAQVEVLRPQVDLLLTSIHAGHEFFLSPSPRQVAAYRAAAMAGADAIIGHHPHVLNGWERERHHGCPIFYSLGNFCFDSDYVCAYPYWELGLALFLRADRHGLLAIEGLPYQINQGHSVTALKGTAFETFVIWWEGLNRLLSDEAVWRAAWRRNCMERYETESRAILIREIDALAGDAPGWPALRWLNRFRCPTSLEYYQEIFSTLAENHGLAPD